MARFTFYQMFRLVSSILFTILVIGNTYSQKQFSTPVEGKYGEDFIIVNYFDWSNTGIQDYQCNTKTYDGHKGTDFVLKNFHQMDSGVYVLAADGGIVLDLHDGEFDREKQSFVSKGLGNFVAIYHANGHFSFYGHLKKNSILVKYLDTVSQGQILGQIGSSGYSTDPHLHFEVWDESNTAIDPFSGSCGNTDGLWINELAYDSSFNTWNSGFSNFGLSIDTLKEPPPSIDTFTSMDTAIAFWAEMYGVRTHDVFRAEWWNPSNIKWIEFTYTAQKDWWLFYYWTYINTPPDIQSGLWTFKLFRNEMEILSKNFLFDGNSSGNNIQIEPKLFLSLNDKVLTISSNEIVERIEIVDINGHILIDIKMNGNSKSINLQELKSSIYFVRATTISKKGISNSFGL